MGEVRLFGRELPDSIKKQEGAKPAEHHEAMREQLYARIIRDAEATQHFIDWVDSVTTEMSEDEIKRRLAEQTKKALGDIAPEYVHQVRQWIKLSAKEQEMSEAITDQLDSSDDLGTDAAPENNSEYARLKDSADQLFEKVRENPDFDLVVEIEKWTDAILQATKEVQGYQQDPERARKMVNKMIQTQDSVPLKKEEIVKTIFEPFVVQFILKPEAFQRLWGNPRDILGFYKPGTSFAFIKEQEDWSPRIKQQTIRHESTHRIIDQAHSHGRDYSYSKIKKQLATTVKFLNLPHDHEANLMLQTFAKDYLLKLIRASSLDQLHNEFLAELNNARFQDNQSLSGKHWATAESEARAFPKLVANVFEQIRSLDPVFAEKITQGNLDLYAQFKRAKEAVVQALQLASFLEDSGARSFVTAAVFVMPMRSYHHLPEVLKRKYSAETLARAKEEVTFDLMMHGNPVSLMRGHSVPSFERLDTFLLSQTEEKKGIKPLDWSKKFSSMRYVCVAAWKITSLDALMKIVKRMQKWPPRFIEDQENNPMIEVSGSFFDNILDQLWRTGKLDIPCDPTTIKKTPILRSGLLEALRISFSGGLYAEELSQFLHLTNRNPTRKEVQTSAMADFCIKAGLGTEFEALVEQYVPKDA